MSKICKVCNNLKPLEEFYKTTRQGKHYGYHGKCKQCYMQKQKEKYSPEKRREESLKRLYNLSTNDYEELLQRQNRVCAICGSTDSKGRKSGRGGPINVFFVDHNHKTGQVRGLLCNTCNRTIGYINEDTDILKKMIEYIENSKNQ